jgi:hypothetical protein
VDLLLLVVLALLLVVLAFAFASGYVAEPAVPEASTPPIRCPMCHKDRLEPLETSTVHQLRPLLLCGACGAEFREGLDGMLTLVQPS